MKYVYASKTGHVQKIIDKLGLTKEALKIETGTEKIDGEYIIFTYTTGKGKTPTAVEKFLVANPNVKAVVGSGRRAEQMAKEFIKNNYNNVKIIKGGIQGIEKENIKVLVGE